MYEVFKHKVCVEVEVEVEVKVFFFYTWCFFFFFFIQNCIQYTTFRDVFLYIIFILYSVRELKDNH